MIDVLTHDVLVALTVLVVLGPPTLVVLYALAFAAYHVFAALVWR